MHEKLDRQPVTAAQSAHATSAPRSSDRRWFVHIAETTYGPYSQNEIKKLAIEGRLVGSDWLCPEGGSAWIEAKNESTLGSMFRTQDAVPRPRTIATAGAARMREKMRDLSYAVGNTAATAAGKPWWKRFGYDPAPLFGRTDQESIRDDLYEFFGPRAGKFLAVYDKMRAAKKPYIISWNWPVFLTIFVWHFYRKMYLLGAVLMLCQFVGLFVFGNYGLVIYAVAVAAGGNRQYVLWAMQRLEKADALGLVAEKRQDYLRRAGGVSGLAATLAAIIQAMFVALTIYGFYLMSSSI